MLRNDIIGITFRIIFQMMIDKTLANQNVPDFKKLTHLKWQATTEKCAYSKQNVTRDARYTGTLKIPVSIIFQTVRYHDFAQFCISYNADPKFTCRWQCSNF